jgi:hypothetical protein
MKRKLWMAGALCMMTGSALASADPQLLGLLMPDAQMVAGAQLGEAKASAFGQFILARAGSATEFDKLRAETGFDPRTDLTEVIVGAALPTAGSAPNPDAAIVAGRGVFQPARLINLAKQHGASTEDYRGISIIAPGPGEQFAFLDGTMVVMSSNKNVKSAIDRWLSGARFTGGLANAALEAAATSQAWMAAAGIQSLLPTPPAGTPTTQQSEMMRGLFAKIQTISGNVTLGSEITLHGRVGTPSPQDAQALADVVRFVTGLAQGSAQGQALPTPTASFTGSTVDFSVAITEAQAEKMFGQHHR